MSNTFKSYILMGILLGAITKFPFGNWESILSIFAVGFIMAYFRASILDKSKEDSIREYIKSLREMGFHKEADKVEKLFPQKKSFIEQIKEDMENYDE